MEVAYARFSPISTWRVIYFFSRLKLMMWTLWIDPLTILNMFCFCSNLGLIKRSNLFDWSSSQAIYLWLLIRRTSSMPATVWGFKISSRVCNSYTILPDFLRWNIPYLPSTNYWMELSPNPLSHRMNDFFLSATLSYLDRISASGMTSTEMIGSYDPFQFVSSLTNLFGSW